MAMQLTREEAGNLTDQELDAYAKLILDESRSRRTKLDRAMNYRGRQIIPVVIAFAATGASYFYTQLGWQVILVFFAVVALLHWHTAGINKRIDALLELLELDSITSRSKDL